MQRRILEPCRTPTMELFRENIQRLLAINFFWKKAPLQALNWAPNTPPSCNHEIKLINFANAMREIMSKS